MQFLLLLNLAGTGSRLQLASWDCKQRLSDEITCCCRRRWKFAKALTITRIGNRIPAVLSTRSFISKSECTIRGIRSKNNNVIKDSGE